MALTKQGEFTDKVTNLPDVPSPTFTPTQIKNTIQQPSEDLKVTINNAFDKLNSTSDGDSGADNIGATGFDGTASTPQAMLEDLNTRKAEKGADWTGTWQGFNPSQVDQTIRDQVNTNTSQLADNLNDLMSKGVNLLYPHPPLVAAKGDGVTDDTQAIQNLVNHASNNSTTGGLVFAPNAKYLIGNVSIPWRIRFIGESFDTIFIPLDNQYAFSIGGNDIEMAWFRIKSQDTEARTATIKHGIKIDGGSVYWERLNLHDLRIDYLNGSAMTLLGSVRESWFSRIHSRSCGNDTSPVIDIESTLANSEPANYQQWSHIMVNFAYGISIRITAEYTDSSRTGNWGLSFKDVLIHGGDPNNHYIPNPYDGIYLDNISDSVFENIHVTNINTNNKCINLTSTKTYRSMRNVFKSLTLGGVVAEAVQNDPAQTGGTGLYIDFADTTYFEVKPIGLTEDFHITANAIRAYLGMYQIILGSPNFTNLSGSFSHGDKHFAPTDFNGQKANGIDQINMASGIMIYSGAGNPENSLTANAGSLFMSTDLGKLFVKETGTGNTGWIQK